MQVTTIMMHARLQLYYTPENSITRLFKRRKNLSVDNYFSNVAVLHYLQQELLCKTKMCESTFFINAHKDNNNNVQQFVSGLLLQKNEMSV